MKYEDLDRDELLSEVKRLDRLINNPEIHDFTSAVIREAIHQQERWSVDHDLGKTPADWFWLLGYLSGKALASAITGDFEKALHHIISSAAALANWHRAITGSHTSMRPGAADPDWEKLYQKEMV
jgi:hypothetical protein